MAFVPPVAGHARDRARSEVFARRPVTIQEESEINSATSRRSSLLATIRTVDNSLPYWFETGFAQLDTRERVRNPFQDDVVEHLVGGYPAESSVSVDEAARSDGVEQLLSRYQCQSVDVAEFGGVGQISQSQQGTKVAITRVLKGLHVTVNDARREITILSLVADPSIPSLVEWLEVPDALWTVKLFRPYQTLTENINLHGPLSDVMLRKALNQLFSGITCLFLAGFAHLRLCPDTVCLDEHQQIVIKDLHFACVYGKEKVGNFYAPTQEKYGSDVYVAPEVFANNTYNARKATMWSCGVLVYFMITGQTDRLNNIEHPSFEKSTTEDMMTLDQIHTPQRPPSSHRKLSVAHAKSKIILYPDRFAVPNYARQIIPKMLIADPMRRAELIEVATRVPKEYAEKAARPLMELAWVDYKTHVGPYAGLNVGAGGTNEGSGWTGGLQSSASSIISAASQWSNPFGSLLGKGHARRRSEPVTSRFTRHM